MVKFSCGHGPCKLHLWHVTVPQRFLILVGSVPASGMELNSRFFPVNQPLLSANHSSSARTCYTPLSPGVGCNVADLASARPRMARHHSVVGSSRLEPVVRLDTVAYNLHFRAIVQSKNCWCRTCLSFVMVMNVVLVRRQRVHKVSRLLSALYCYTESGEWTRHESEFSQTGHEEPRVQLCSPNGQLPWCLVGTPIKSTKFPSTTAFLQNLWSTSQVCGNVRKRPPVSASQGRPLQMSLVGTRTQEVFHLETSYHHHNRCIDVPLCSLENRWSPAVTEDL